MRLSVVRLAMVALPMAIVLSGCPPKPELGGVPQTLHFGTTVDPESGETVYETEKQFQVFNSGSDRAMLTFSIGEPSQGWITVVADGPQQSQSEEDPVTVTVTIDRDFSAAKNITDFTTGSFEITSNDGNQTVTVTTAPNYFTENFEGSGDNANLDATAFTFVPDGSLSFYRGEQTSIPVGQFPTDPTGGLVLDFVALGDPVETQPLAGKTIPFYGGEFSSIFISTNGTVGIGEPPSGAGDPAQHFTVPQISVFPLDATLGGEVSILQDAEKFVVTYDDVPTGGGAATPEPNDVQLELFFDGKIRISYIETDQFASGVIGLSTGGGDGVMAPEDFIETDISEINTPNGKLAL